MQPHCGKQTITMLNEMLCSSLNLYDLAERGSSVFVFVSGRGARAISRRHNLRGDVDL